VVADVARVERVHEAERPVVDRQPEDRHVVGVQHAVAEADALPLREQARRLARDLLEEVKVGMRRVPALRVEPVDHVIGQLLQRVVLLGPVEVLERPEAHEARRQAGGDGRGFDGLADHRRVGADDRQRAGGGNAEVMQRLGAQELADRGTQHGPAVAHP
jgi:hypothetical protein